MRKIIVPLLVIGVVFGMSTLAHAYELLYRLEVTGATWALKAATDAPGGIASIVVELTGAATATSVAPRGELGGSGTPVTGFTVGNIFAGNQFAGNQVFAGQDTSSGFSLVKQIGFADVPDTAIAPPGTTLIGSGLRDSSGFVTFYTGTNTTPFSTHILYSEVALSGSVWANVNDTTPIGPDQGLAVYEAALPPPDFYFADFNEDGDVDGEDFVIWQTHFPTETRATHATGDSDFDGDIDGADFVKWQIHFPTVLIEPPPPVPDPRPGDFDADGDVDGRDFVAWQTTFPKHSGATWAMGDADGDGDVDGADFIAWQDNFPTMPGQGASPVPEPQALLLAAIGMFGIVCRYRCRKIVGRCRLVASAGLLSQRRVRWRANHTELLVISGHHCKNAWFFGGESLDYSSTVAQTGKRPIRGPPSTRHQSGFNNHTQIGI